MALGMELASRSLRLLQELSLLRELRLVRGRVSRIDGTTPMATEARLWLGKAYTYNQFNDPAQAGPALRAASLFLEAGDRQAQAVALARAGASLMTNGKTAESEPLLREAHDLLRPFGVTKHLAACLHYVGVCRFFAGDGATAQDLIEQAAAMARALGDWPGLRIILNSLAEMQGFAGIGILIGPRSPSGR